MDWRCLGGRTPIFHSQPLCLRAEICNRLAVKSSPDLRNITKELSMEKAFTTKRPTLNCCCCNIDDKNEHFVFSNRDKKKFWLS